MSGTVCAKLVTRCGCSRHVKIDADLVERGIVLIALDAGDTWVSRPLPDIRRREFRLAGTERGSDDKWTTYIFKEVIT